jgi:ABC-2 type transport system ATP-binding protein
MTTHILEVAERMADRIGVISRGRLIAEGSLEDLRRQVSQQVSQQAGHQAGDAAGHAAAAGGASLEDTFLALVAEQAEAA